MAILTYPLNGVLYDAEDAETYLCTRTSGVFASDGHFPASVTGQREVTIGPGLAWMNNEEYHGKAIYNPENVTLKIAEADAYQTRIDRIVLRFDKLLNKTDLMVLEGTPANSPQAPDIERDSLVYDLGLYTVTVKNSTASISASDISSTMLDESVCGIMEDAVTSIPTQELYDQWYSWFANLQTDTEAFETQFNLWFEQIKEEADQYMTDTKNEFEVWMNGTKVDFDTWFDTVQDTLDSDTAGKLFDLVSDAQDTADEALEQLITGTVRGFMTDEYEGGEYGLLADDADDSHAITLSKNICDCEGNDSASMDMISDEFNENHTYSEGDYCIYENTLFRFTADKSAGAWDWSCVEATNVGTELTNQKSGISSLPVEHYISDNNTVAGSGNDTFSCTLTKIDGYIPILVNVRVYNATTGGVNSSRCYTYNMYNTSSYAYCGVRNTGSADAVIALDFTILWIPGESATASPQSIPDDDGDTEIAPGPEIIDPDDDTGGNEPDDDDTNVGTLEPGEVIPDDDDNGDDDTVIGPGPEEVE